MISRIILLCRRFHPGRLVCSFTQASKHIVIIHTVKYVLALSDPWKWTLAINDWAERCIVATVARLSRSSPEEPVLITKHTRLSEVIGAKQPFYRFLWSAWNAIVLKLNWNSFFLLKNFRVQKTQYSWAVTLVCSLGWDFLSPSLQLSANWSVRHEQGYPV